MKKERSSADTPQKREHRVEIAVFSVLGAIFLFVAAFLAGWFGRYAAIGENGRALLWAIETAKKNYYKEVDEDELYSQIFAGLELDDYSCFYTANQYRRIANEKEGNNEGAGFSVYVDEEGYIRIFYVDGNSPAEEAGLKNGMYLFAYGTSEAELVPAYEIKDNRVVGKINEFIKFAGAQRGEFVLQCGLENKDENTTTHTLAMKKYAATYCVYRDSSASFAFRGEKPVITETGEPLEGLDDATAYIRLSEFNGNAAKEFKECLDKMKEQKRSNLVLDLRMNGGGYMDVLIDIASHLLKEVKGTDPVIAYAQFRNGEKISYAASGSDYNKYFNENSKITVLADENTASASECLIGALYDYGTITYGDIILRKDAETGLAKTYGKGIMQSYFQDKKGNVLKLTVAEIFWPKGNSIHGKGVTEGNGTRSIEAPELYDAADSFLQDALRMIKTPVTGGDAV